MVLEIEKKTHAKSLPNPSLKNPHRKAPNNNSNFTQRQWKSTSQSMNAIHAASPHNHSAKNMHPPGMHDPQHASGQRQHTQHIPQCTNAIRIPTTLDQCYTTPTNLTRRNISTGPLLCKSAKKTIYFKRTKYIWQNTTALHNPRSTGQQIMSCTMTPAHPAPSNMPHQMMTSQFDETREWEPDALTSQHTTQPADWELWDCTVL